MYMRSRTLSSSEVTKNRKIFVDDYYSDNLLILDLYYNGLDTNKGYDIYSFSYGNLASTIKVVPPVDPPYLTFTPSAFTSSLSLQDSYSWIYNNIGATSSTITVYKHDDSLDNHFATGSITLDTTSVTVLAASQKCLLVSSSSNYYIYETISLNGSLSFIKTDITFNVNFFMNKNSWRVSNDCLFVSAGK